MLPVPDLGTRAGSLVAARPVKQRPRRVPSCGHLGYSHDWTGVAWRAKERSRTARLVLPHSLACADQAGALSVAFPARSTGVYRFPVELAASIAVAGRDASTERPGMTTVTGRAIKPVPRHCSPGVARRIPFRQRSCSHRGLVCLSQCYVVVVASIVVKCCSCGRRVKARPSRTDVKGRYGNPYAHQDLYGRRCAGGTSERVGTKAVTVEPPVEAMSPPAGRAVAAEPLVVVSGGSVRTSLSFPLGLHDRLGVALREYRWTLPDLLRRGLRDVPSVEVAEACWRAQRGERCAPRGVQMATEIKEALDTLAGDWRMSRSQVAGLLLTLVLDDLTVAPIT